MSTNNAPPQQRKKVANNRHIPPEILEMILSNLPVKSLLRFSSASKPFNSLIFGRDFVKKHRRRQRIALNHSDTPDELSHLSSCPFSAVLPDGSTVEAAALVSPFKHPVSMKAFCDELWCVEYKVTKSLYLWNPSMRTCTKLPTPSTKFHTINGYDNYGNFNEHRNRSRPYKYVYGLGYDSVGDDYKILKLGLGTYDKPRVAELYSLRSNSWSAVKAFPGDGVLCYNVWRNMGLFVAGALHWVVIRPCRMDFSDGTIVSFDLSTHDCGEVGLPKFDRPTTNIFDCLVETIAMRGKLCLSVYYETDYRTVFWAMEDYGVVESWTKKLDIRFRTVASFPFGWNNPMVIRPLYFYDNGNILARTPCDEGGETLYFYDNGNILGRRPCEGGERYREEAYLKIFLCERDEGKLWRKHFRSQQNECRIFGSFLYKESLVSPAMYLGKEA